MALSEDLGRDDFLVVRLSWRPWVPETGTHQRHISRIEHSHWRQKFWPQARWDQRKQGNHCLTVYDICVACECKPRERVWVQTQVLRVVEGCSMLVWACQCRSVEDVHDVREGSVPENMIATGRVGLGKRYVIEVP